MNIACKLITVAAMLVHSIFGCSLHHACACESRAYGEYQHATGVEPVDSCQHDHDRHHGETPCGHDHEEKGKESVTPNAIMSDGCECCERAPCEHDDSPCCSEVLCSFIVANDIEFSLDAGTVLFVLIGDDSALVESSRAKFLANFCRLRSGFDDSPSRCALHCSWQI